MDRSGTVAVVLPALDEAEALDWLLPRMPPRHVPYVVDNGSTDATVEVAREHGAEIVSESLRGFGAACWAGLAATEAHAVVAFMDADGSLDPRSLPAVTTPVQRRDADLVLGRRVVGRGAMSLHQRLANSYLAWVLRRRHGVQVRDLGPMRAARRSALLDIGIEDRRSGWPLEMVTRAASAGWRVREVPVPYGPRRGGRSKVTGTLRGTVGAVVDMRRVLVT
jgi:glycosyltransferase involved in cell wall biosynthesis